MTLLEKICDELTAGKASDMVCLPTEKSSGGLFAHIVIVTANSGRHGAALSDRVLRICKNSNHPKPKVETSAEHEWSLIDCGDFIVHIMQEEAREHYRLESLWGIGNH